MSPRCAISPEGEDDIRGEPWRFDFAVIATGVDGLPRQYVWPGEDLATRALFSSPWSGLHEAVQDIVPHLTKTDRERFDAGLGKIFMDNYAAVPSEAVRRLLALCEAGIIRLPELGPDYKRRTADRA